MVNFTLKYNLFIQRYRQFFIGFLSNSLREKFKTKMSKILVAKMQLLTALQQGNMKEAQVLLSFINKHDKKATEN